jgi:Bacterial transcriptional activator domain
LIARNPFRERLRGQLMLALYRSGRQVKALETYQETRRTLVEELGIEPSQPLQELEQAILRHDPRLVGRPAAERRSHEDARRKTVTVLVKLVRGRHSEEFLDELTAFPHGAHDDCVDALSGAHNLLVRRGSGRMTSHVPRGRIDLSHQRRSGTTDPDELSASLGAIYYPGHPS